MPDFEAIPRHPFLSHPVAPSIERLAKAVTALGGAVCPAWALGFIFLLTLPVANQAQTADSLPAQIALSSAPPVSASPLALSAEAVRVTPNPNPKRHHTATGFKNNYTGSVNKSFLDLAQWQMLRLRDRLPPPPTTPTAVVPPDLPFIHTNGVSANMQPAVTWIGHATSLVQAGGLNVLTDPIFSERAAPVQFAGPKRVQPPGLQLAELPPVDVVLISHNHYDHLDKKSVIALANTEKSATLFIVPLGLKVWFESVGVRNVKEIDWWDTVTIVGRGGQPVEFTLTPVQHWSARGVGDRSQTLWGGWAVLTPQFHWYFSGDTGYSQDFADTRAHFAPRQTAANGGGFDLALIPIGAYEPRWFMQQQHVNPAEAVQIHKDLGAKRSIGMHWGTFELTDEPLDQPPQDLAVARKAQGVVDDDFGVLAIGQTLKLTARKPAP